MPVFPSSPSLSIRPARPDEAAAVAELMERTFRDTYSGNSSAAELEKFVAGHFGAERQRRELADPGLVTLLAEVDGEGEGEGERTAVAFAQLRPHSGGRTPGCVEARRPAELSRFYVDHAWHGRGVAGPLMAACVATVAAAGADALWLMVYRINARAIAFYRRQGFAPVGTAPFHFGDEIHEDIVMVHPVAARASDEIDGERSAKRRGMSDVARGSLAGRGRAEALSSPVDGQRSERGGVPPDAPA